MDNIVFALSLIIIMLLTGSLVVIWHQATMVHHAGIGRILYWALATIKLWADIAVLYFAINSRWPSFYGDIHDIRRTGVRLFLALYLTVQAAGVNIALVRWRPPAWYRRLRAHHG